MSVDIIVGAQWGDEGKGKIADILAEKKSLVIRYQGGNNAGHTVVVGDDVFKLHHIPSGILYDSCCSVMSGGVVIDPKALLHEMDALVDRGVQIDPAKFKLSSTAHVVLPFHRKRDSSEEDGRSDQKIGTTGRGIGPAYTDKIARYGVRVMDLLDKDRLRKKIFSSHWGEGLDASFDKARIVDDYVGFGQRLRPFVADTSLLIHQAISQKKSILFEGAQGTLLDIDHGTYPFVTSSSPTAGGACASCGVGPRTIDRVIGVSKAYVTRVGEGPFPTELFDRFGDFLRNKGDEFGTTTQRPRRCGWLDLVALKYAVRINGLTDLCLTKLDVLDDLESIRLCTHYHHQGQMIEEFPLDMEILAACEPHYVDVPGWKSDIRHIQSADKLPQKLRGLIDFISEQVGVKVSIISVGSKRSQTLFI